jgi:catechol 2,3-dioxygenase
MTYTSALWPARLHHLFLTHDAPGAIADWYRVNCDLTEERFGEATLVSADQRTIVVARGSAGVRQFGYALKDSRQAARLRAQIEAAGTSVVTASDVPGYEDAFGARDPDGNLIVFGVDRARQRSRSRLPGRLQHIVFATTDVLSVVAFYTDLLGFKVSDFVKDERGDVTACFMRSDAEHHSLAFFRADHKRLDHISFEATSWNDIRDWGDHFAAQRIPIIWGAGRHGAGNNLFIFVRDPLGTMVEISAEIERVPYEAAPRTWPHEERTINLWGKGMLRS